MVRLVHISRTSLLPYEQDLFDPAGRVATQVFYENYQKFGDIQFPTQITINRPIDEYSLKIAVVKLIPNDKLDDDQFDLKIPDGVTVQKLP